MDNSKEPFILVVDDETANARILRLILEKKGFPNSGSAHTGKAALTFLGISHENDEAEDVGTKEDIPGAPAATIVLLDVMLPDMTGFDVCRRIKRRYGDDVLVILLTGFEISEYIAQGISSGADDFLSKPVSPDELVARIKLLVTRRSVLTPKSANARSTQSQEHTREKMPTSVLTDISIGDYLIEDMLTWSASTIVYTVSNIHTGKMYVLKRLLKQVLKFPDVIGRFRREISIMKRIDHPNICRIIADGEINGCPYCVMDYIDGDNFETILNRSGPVDFELAYSIAHGLASALKAVHDAGIVHRDIKLDNIYLTRDGIVQLGDFGVAIQIGESRLTQHGYVVGTPIYMAPEQFDGKAPVTPATDVYSYGAALYHLIAGEPPFTADNTLVLIQRHLKNHAPSLTVRRPDIAGVWDQLIIDRCLCKDPHSRAQTMVEILSDLERSKAKFQSPR